MTTDIHIHINQQKLVLKRRGEDMSVLASPDYCWLTLYLSNEAVANLKQAITLFEQAEKFDKQEREIEHETHIHN